MMPIRTVEEARAFRAALDKVLPAIAADPAKVNDSLSCIAPWQPGTAENPRAWALNDVRKENDIPYRCCQAHTHCGETGWNPSHAPALWTEYHGTSPETARPWKQPTGAHDQYLTDEYMIFTDSKVYRCISANGTAYSPTEYAAAWEEATA